MFPTQPSAEAAGQSDPVHLYVVHEAVRRDLRRFARTAAAQLLDGDGTRWARADRWDLLARMLRHHLDGFATGLGPLLQEYAELPHETLAGLAAARPPLEAALDVVAVVLREPDASPAGVIGTTSERVESRLAEEAATLIPVLPLVPVEAWNAYVEDQRTALSPEEEAVALPWLLEGLDPATAARATALLPDHVRRTLYDVWIPAYDDRSRGVWEQAAVRA